MLTGGKRVKHPMFSFIIQANQFLDVDSLVADRNSGVAVTSFLKSFLICFLSSNNTWAPDLIVHGNSIQKTYLMKLVTLDKKIISQSDNIRRRNRFNKSRVLIDDF